MEKKKNNINKVIAIILILALLALTFLSQGKRNEFISNNKDNSTTSTKKKKHNNNKKKIQNLTDVGCPQCIFGSPVPSVLKDNIVIKHNILTLSNNQITKFADWVAYWETKEQSQKRFETTRNWKADPMLDDAVTLEPQDYKQISKLGYDRGHQAPLASFQGSQYWTEANLLSNITPQNGKLNKGIWKALEEKERGLTQKFDTVWVITGPYYESMKKSRLVAADEDVVVPSGYWKIFITKEFGKVQTAAFLFEQTVKAKDSYMNHIVSIDQIEIKTEYDFFSNTEIIDEKSTNEGWIKRTFR